MWLSGTSYEVVADYVGGPAVGSNRGFTDNHDPRFGEDRPRRVEDHVGRSEPAGNDRVDRPIEETRQLPGIGGEDADPVADAKAGDETAKMIGTRHPSIDEDEAQIGPAPGDHQTRDAAAAAEVDHRSGDVCQGVDERHAVVDDVGDRGDANHAVALRGRQRLDQRGVS